MLSNASLALCATIAFALGTTHAGAQTVPWDREVHAIAVVPAADGSSTSDVHVVWRALVEGPLSVPLDLSTNVLILVDGTAVASQSHVVQIDPASGGCFDGPICSGSCGSGSYDGVANDLFCLEEAPGDCMCGTLDFLSSFPSQDLVSGNELQVLLTPSPAAANEPDTSNDALTVPIDQAPIYWQTTLSGIDLIQQAPGMYTVRVDSHVEWSGVHHFSDQDPIVMSREHILLVNGTAIDHAIDDRIAVPGGGCGEAGDACGTPCGTLNGQQGICLDTAGGPTLCGCTFDADIEFPNVLLTPGDEVMVLLRPVPGALPELPGFDEDDELDILCCPIAGLDDAAGAPSISTTLGQNTPNPFNPTTRIPFSLDGAADVSLAIYDLTGHHVRTLADGAHFAAGSHELAWDGVMDSGVRVRSGIYVARLTVDGRTMSRKMTVLK